MPKLDISYKDLKQLFGRDISIRELEEESLLFIKGEFDGIDNDTLKVDCKETNRPDLWSTEGIARQLKGNHGIEKGIPQFKLKPSGIKVKVEKGMEKIRPYIVAAVARDIKITEDLLIQMIQLQEKVCLTYGRKRREAAIGIYDLDKLSPPIFYKAVAPDGIKFIPLESDKLMTPREILQRHPKGIEYSHLLESFQKYPIVMDSKNEVASMPPVINSDYTGKVTDKTKNLFIEVTGLDKGVVMTALNVVVAALSDRGAKLESVEIDYPDARVISPNFTPKKAKISISYINKISGLNLKNSEIKILLEKARYNVKITNNIVELEYPSYRQDIMHPVDIVEDIIIAYGYNSIEPIIPEISTVGDLDEFEVFAEKVRNLLPGVGAQELLNFTLTNKDMLFKKMNLEESEIVEIANPVSALWSSLRNWNIPSLLEFFTKNVSQEYPQQIYEVGDSVIIDQKAETHTKTIKRLAWAEINADTNYTKARQVLDYVLRSLGISDYTVEDAEHNSFISGRVGCVLIKGRKVAYIGEIHPQVLDNFNLKMPVSAFELNLTDLYEILE
ncbi:phenylalanine--tRNA ligase subunit beta [Candidatus Woesearchaeota archaeon]|nr:phenylalanine--tRNA ligase subunit beta [Candidatus Woesearchaeota archaeon]